MKIISTTFSDSTVVIIGVEYYFTHYTKKYEPLFWNYYYFYRKNIAYNKIVVFIYSYNLPALTIFCNSKI